MGFIIYPFYFMIFIFGWRFFRYLSTPLLTRLGFYKYYSPLFMTMPSLGKTLDFHLGTSYDFFKLDKVTSRVIFLYLAEGLTKISEEINDGRIPIDTILYGNTFYLKKASLEKLGFTARRMNPFETFLFILNYFELCVLKSITMKKPVLIPIKNIWIIKISASELIKNIKLYQSFHQKLGDKLLP